MAKTLGRAVYDFLDERFLLSDIITFGRKKMVPEHRRSFWYFFGGICLFLTGIQVATGLLLLLYYTPHVDFAHESVQFIMSQVKFGWLIRSVHSWTANILIGVIFVHMFSTFFLKAYRKPRELTWMTGFFLLVMFMAFGFSGYLLPWNELSYFATRVGTDIAGSLPLIGKWLKTVILGGPDVSQATLSRFFWFHVALLPLAALAFIGLHVLLVQTLGMSKPVGVRETREIPFFPDFLLKDAVGWTLILVLVGVLCVFLPWEVGPKADPFAPTPLGIKPEWYFTFMFTTLKIVPPHIFGLEGEMLAILGFLAGGLLWLLVPFLDRRAARDERSRVFTWIGLAVALYIIVMTVLTYTVPKL
ncbi:MAG: cytochrome bc complex cytochrome b subunit [Candidatus Aminicenantes bacterium]|nr:cytochrome bc complex cytochrome b subunit [Candidatus Aminicenantes bacterium]